MQIGSKSREISYRCKRLLRLAAANEVRARKQAVSLRTTNALGIDAAARQKTTKWGQKSYTDSVERSSARGTERCGTSNCSCATSNTTCGGREQQRVSSS